MMRPGDTGPDATHARLDRPRRLELSPEPATARRQLSQLLSPRWERDVGDVVLAVSEALVNARKHAGGARRVHAWVAGASLLIEVCDRGRAFDPRPYVEQPPELLAERGRGLWLMSRLADACEVHHNDEGGRLVLRFDLGQRSERGLETVANHPQYRPAP